jgi:hypothetical protein
MAAGSLHGNPNYRPGEIVHTLGYPLDMETYGGGWIYHMNKGLLSLGLVIGADWTNPYLSPYRTLQVTLHCTHPCIWQTRPSSENETPPPVSWLTHGIREFQPIPHSLRCKNPNRRWITVYTSVAFPGRSTYRLFCWICQYYQNQRHTQCHEDRHAGGGISV